MSPWNRTRRAADKQRARSERRHRSPEPTRWPLTRTPVAQLLLNPHAPAADVPVELAERDYPFPVVELPDARPLVTPQELRAALDDTQPIERVPVLHFANDFLLPVCGPRIGEMVTSTPDADSVTCRECLNWLEHVPERSVLDGLVLDDEPQPALHEGLAPAATPHIPVPSLPFLNAHPPQPGPDEQPTQALVGGGNALPARLTGYELSRLGRPIPDDAPPAVKPPTQPLPVWRNRQHPRVFNRFDDEFWEQIETLARQTQAGPGSLEMSNDDAMGALLAHLRRVEAAHQAGIERVAAHEYRGRLADASRPLPHRVPGASLELVVAL